MKTKTIYEATAAFLAMVVFILFMMNGCSKDDSDPDPVITSWELPAGDFPSVTISKEGNEPVIGDPIKTITKIHVGNFAPSVNAYFGKEWHGRGYYDKAGCANMWDYWSVEGELWSDELPEQNFYWDFPWPCPNESYLMTTSKLTWNEDQPQRFKIMNEGQWNEEEIKTPLEWVNGDIKRDTYFKQVLGHPDLYITMERDYEILPGNDEIFQGGRSYEIITTNALGVEETQINTMGASLSVEVSASYGFVSGSINATVYAESTKALTINKFSSLETKVNWTVPAGEKWRNLTLTKVERYYFSDSEGNRWDSDNLDIEEIGELTNYIGMNPYEIHYKDSKVISWAVGSDDEIDEIESIK